MSLRKGDGLPLHALRQKREQIRASVELPIIAGQARIEIAEEHIAQWKAEQGVNYDSESEKEWIDASIQHEAGGLYPKLYGQRISHAKWTAHRYRGLATVAGPARFLNIQMAL